MNITRPLAGAALAGVVALGLAACGSDDETQPLPSSGTLDMDDATPSPSAAPSASAGDDLDADDQPIDDATRQRLERVALQEVGDGRVEDVDRSDDRSHAYEVDVELGRDDDVTVEISEDFQVVRVDR